MKVVVLRTPESRLAFQNRVLRDLCTVDAMIDAPDLWHCDHHVGVEQELQFVGEGAYAAMIGEKVNAALAEPPYKQEFSRFTFEIALPPQPSGADMLDRVEGLLSRHVRAVSNEAARHGARTILCGIIPSLRRQDLRIEALTRRSRYLKLHELRQGSKEDGYSYHVRGIDDLVLANSEAVLLDGCFTSLQLHWQLERSTAAAAYNWSQHITAPCLAAACCSPLLLGKRLWHETRIILFKLASDLRPGSGGAPGDLLPRATLGRNWIKAITDVWKEDLAAYAPQLMGEPEDEQSELPGSPPPLHALQFFNGTAYRWNRLCYSPGPSQRASIRVEARALPAGLTQTDQIANAALWWGLMSMCAERGDAIAMDIPFSRTRESFRRAARDGMESQLYWNGRSRPASEVLLEEALPLAKAGLDRLGVDDPERRLRPVEERARTKQTASRWMLDTYESLLNDYDAGRSSVYLTEAMLELGAAGDPVARWPKRRRTTASRSADLPLRCGDALDLAERRLVWAGTERLPVEDELGERVELTRSEVEAALASGYRTVGEAICPKSEKSLETPTISAFGTQVELRRSLFHKKSGVPGPLFVIVAGLHGNERNGVAAMAEFGAQVQPKRGSVAGLLGNLPALKRNARYIDRDLNRTFLEEDWPTHNIEGRQARALWQVLDELAAGAAGEDCWLIDLHGTSGHTPPYASSLSAAAAWPLSGKLPLSEVRGFESMIGGSLVQFAACRGWKAVTFELGALVAPASVANGEAILRLIADRLGIDPLSPEARRRTAKTLRSQSSIRRLFRFVYRHPVTPEDHFQMRPGYVSFQAIGEGEPLGLDANGEVRSPCSGRILMPLYQRQGESGFYIIDEIEDGDCL